MRHTIGIFDSGVGGLTIWRELFKLMSGVKTIYLGDGVNAPYGEKSPEAIIDLSRRNTRWLIDQGSTVIVVACNTATTNAISTLRNEFDLPFIGIEPATKPAAVTTKTGVIGILATKGTFASKLFINTSKDYRNKIEIIETVGTRLVDLIESGQLEETRPLLKKYLLPMVDKNIDTLVLGCTHYPYLIALINDILPKKISIVEPSKAIAKRVQSLIADADQSDNSDIEHKFYTTADVKVMTRFLKNEGLENPNVQRLSFTS